MKQTIGYMMAHVPIVEKDEPFFCRLTLTDNRIVEIKGSGEITKEMIQEYKYILAKAEIGTLCTSIGNQAFYFTYITDITIPDSVTNIGIMALANTNFTDLTLPNSVTTIDSSAFYYCGLVNIRIGSNITSIGRDAFQFCTKLINVTIEATTPPLIDRSFNYNATGRKIYVPATSVEAYKADPNWSIYAADIEPIPS